AIPRIERSAIKRIVSEKSCTERRHIRSAYNDGSSLTPISHTRAVCLCDTFLECDDAIRRSAARNINIDLNRDRHTVQRTERLTACYLPVGNIRSMQRFIAKRVDHRIYLRIDLLEARQTCFDRFATLDDSRFYRMRKFARRPAPKIVRHGPPQQLLFPRVAVRH